VEEVGVEGQAGVFLTGDLSLGEEAGFGGSGWS
jgi:hypothetical protein